MLIVSIAKAFLITCQQEAIVGLVKIMLILSFVYLKLQLEKNCSSSLSRLGSLVSQRHRCISNMLAHEELACLICSGGSRPREAKKLTENYIQVVTHH